MPFAPGVCSIKRGTGLSDPQGSIRVSRLGFHYYSSSMGKFRARSIALERLPINLLPAISSRIDAPQSLTTAIPDPPRTNPVTNSANRNGGFLPIANDPNDRQDRACRGGLYAFRHILDKFKKFYIRFRHLDMVNKARITGATSHGRSAEGKEQVSRGNQPWNWS
jgi:hypothetical protein